MQVVERLRSCEAACELLEKYNMSYQVRSSVSSQDFLYHNPVQTETNWMDELDSKLRNLEELEAARAKEAWEKHVVSTLTSSHPNVLVTRKDVYRAQVFSQVLTRVWLAMWPVLSRTNGFIEQPFL